MKRYIIIFIILVLVWLVHFVWTCLKASFRLCGNDIHGEYDPDKLKRVVLRGIQSFSVHYKGPKNKFIKVMCWLVFYEKFIDEQFRD